MKQFLHSIFAPSPDKAKKTTLRLFKCLLIALLVSLSWPYVATCLWGVLSMFGIYYFIYFYMRKVRQPGLIIFFAACLVFFILGLKVLSILSLEQAVFKGDIPKIKQLVENGHKVNRFTRSGRTMLTECFRYGLQKVNPFRDKRLIHVISPEQAEDRMYKMIKILIEAGADPNVLDVHGKAPIHYAVERNYFRIVRLLLKSGTDVNLSDESGNTPLILAVKSAIKLDIVRILIDYGADVNVKGTFAYTPLHGAITSGSVEMIKILLDNGARIDVPDKKGNTPLHRAVENGEMDLVKTLLEYGANPQAQNIDGMTPLDIAQKIDQPKIAAILSGQTRP